MAFCAVALLLSAGSSPAFADDLFTGLYLSESRQDFGTSTPGEVRIEVTKEETGYFLKYFRRGKPLFTTPAVECDPRNQTFLGEYWNDANVAGLCTPSGANMLVYTDKPYPSPVERGKVFHSRYYSHVQWAFYAFRKVQ